MKIIVIPNDPTWRGRHYMLAKDLAERGHEVHYVMWDLPYHAGLAKIFKQGFSALSRKDYRHDVFEVHEFRHLPYIWPYINGWLFKIQFKQLFKSLNADIVFSESYTNETEVPKGIPMVYDLADDYAAPAEVSGSKLYKFAFRLLDVRGVMKRQCQNALAVTVVSGELRKLVQKYVRNPILVPNGVDKEIIKKVLKTKNANVKPHSMIYVSGFNQWQLPIEAMRAVIKLRKELMDIELTLVGEGYKVEAIKKFIHEHKADTYIHFVGLIQDRTKLFELINKNAVGLNISTKDPFRDVAHPIKVLEYSALGKPVVSTNLNEVKALKFPNIYTFSVTSERSLMTAMKKAVLDDNDYSAVSTRVLKDYSWADLTDRLGELFESVIVEDRK